MKLKSICLLFALILPNILLAQSNLAHAPKNFKIPEGLAVFTDFKSGTYNLTYDSTKKIVNAVSEIIFETNEEGFPIFDLKDTPLSISLDGVDITSKIIFSPDQETKFRITSKSVAAGSHTLVITSTVREGVSFVAEGVSNAFWFSDLDDRSYLEAYLPANFEYDQYKIILNLDFLNLSRQKIYTNGAITSMPNNRFVIEFPETYTSSSLYFHTAPIGRYFEKSFTFKSLGGNDIPVIIYTPDRFLNLEDVKAKLISSVTILERQYGPFLHKTLTAFMAGSGGMEYAGATMTDLRAMNHELTHSYFARGGFMPSNGNAGWIDEAITRWSDEGSKKRDDIKGIYSNMAGNSEYRRRTHMDAYSIGKKFMEHLNYKFQNEGGLAAFLNKVIQNDAFKPMNTEEFIKKISLHYNEDLTPLFKAHTYSSRGLNHEGGAIPDESAHMKLSIAQMREFL